jgi:hypothetical protein
MDASRAVFREVELSGAPEKSYKECAKLNEISSCSSFLSQTSHWFLQISSLQNHNMLGYAAENPQII